MVDFLFILFDFLVRRDALLPSRLALNDFFLSSFAIELTVNGSLLSTGLIKLPLFFLVEYFVNEFILFKTVKIACTINY